MRRVALALVGVVPIVFCLAYVQAHEDKQTLVPAELARHAGVTTYRVTLRGGGFYPDATLPTETQVRAQLLAPGNKDLGMWHKTIYWRKEWDPKMKIEGPNMTETYGGWKHYETGHESEFKLGGDHVKVEQHADQKTASITINGRAVLDATNVDAIKGKADFSVEDMTAIKQAEPLLRLLSEVERDLRAALLPPKVVTSCCGPGGNGEVVCSIGFYVTGYGSAVYRVDSELRAKDATNSGCWSAYCTGCCDWLGGGDIGIAGCTSGCLIPGIAGGLICDGRCTGSICSCKPGYISLPVPPARNSILKAAS